MKFVSSLLTISLTTYLQSNLVDALDRLSLESNSIDTLDRLILSNHFIALLISLPLPHVVVVLPRTKLGFNLMNSLSFLWYTFIFIATMFLEYCCIDIALDLSCIWLAPPVVVTACCSIGVSRFYFLASCVFTKQNFSQKID